MKKHKITQKNKGYGFGYCVVNANHHNVANTIMATGGSGKERNLVCQYKDGIPGKVIPGKKTPLNSEYIRLMTPAEWGRLQGFIGYAFIEDGKETFSFPENFSDSAKYKVFGNSVTIPVIETMAEYILKCFKKWVIEHIVISFIIIYLTDRWVSCCQGGYVVTADFRKS